MDPKKKTIMGGVIAVVVVVLCIGGYTKYKRNDINGTYYFTARDGNSTMRGGEKTPTITITKDEWITKMPGQATVTKSLTADKKNHTLSITDYGDGSYTYNPKTGKMTFIYNESDVKLTMEKKGSKSGDKVEQDQQKLDKLKKFISSPKLQGTWHMTKMNSKANTREHGYFKSMTIKGNRVTGNIAGVSKHEEEYSGQAHNGKYEGHLVSMGVVDDGHGHEYPTSGAFIVSNKRNYEFFFYYHNGKLQGFSVDGNMSNKTIEMSK